jgi:hypothetical protein
MYGEAYRRELVARRHACWMDSEIHPRGGSRHGAGSVFHWGGAGPTRIASRRARGGNWLAGLDSFTAEP